MPTEPDEQRNEQPADVVAGVDVTVDVDVVANARRRHGAVGAVVAASMLGIDQALGRKPREEAPIVVSSNSDPVDIDSDGITVALEGVAVATPALPRTPPAVAPARRRRR